AWCIDFSGNRIELVVRPLNSGWRYFPSRDAGVRGLAGVIMRSVDIDKDLSIWTGVLGAHVSDWAGDAAYLRIDDAHHRIVLFPAGPDGLCNWGSECKIGEFIDATRGVERSIDRGANGSLMT